MVTLYMQVHSLVFELKKIQLSLVNILCVLLLSFELFYVKVIFISEESHSRDL